MTETRNKTSYRTDHATFGGLIFPSDFNTDRYRGKENIYGSPIAHRIAWDQKFDQYCANNGANRAERNRNGGDENGKTEILPQIHL